MKLFKKVLAIAMASALALTLLVGCGSNGGKTTFTVVDYLNDASILMSSKETTFKADTALDTNAKNAVTVLEKVGAKDVNDLMEKVRKEGPNGENYKALVKAVTGSDTKNAYEISYVQSDRNYVTDAGKNDAGLYQAGELDGHRIVMYVPAGASVEYGNLTGVENTTYVGTATMSLGGKTYLVAVFRTAPKAAK